MGVHRKSYLCKIFYFLVYFLYAGVLCSWFIKSCCLISKSDMTLCILYLEILVAICPFVYICIHDAESCSTVDMCNKPKDVHLYFLSLRHLETCLLNCRNFPRALDSYQIYGSSFLSTVSVSICVSRLFFMLVLLNITIRHYISSSVCCLLFFIVIREKNLYLFVFIVC